MTLNSWSSWLHLLHARATGVCHTIYVVLGLKNPWLWVYEALYQLSYNPSPLPYLFQSVSLLLNLESSLIWLEWLASKPQGSSPRLGLQMYIITPGNFMWVLEIWTQVGLYAWVTSILSTEPSSPFSPKRSSDGQLIHTAHNANIWTHWHFLESVV